MQEGGRDAAPVAELVKVPAAVPEELAVLVAGAGVVGGEGLAAAADAAGPEGATQQGRVILLVPAQEGGALEKGDLTGLNPWNKTVLGLVYNPNLL